MGSRSKEEKSTGHPPKTTEVIVPEVVNEKSFQDSHLAVLLNTVYKEPCKSIQDLAKKSGLSVTIIEEVQEATSTELVKLSNFRDGFAPALLSNIRNLMRIITALTEPGKKCNAFDLQKYTQSLKTLNDMLREVEGKKDKDGSLTKRTIRVAEIIEEFRKPTKH
jgi:hypothetical protein